MIIDKFLEVFVDAHDGGVLALFLDDIDDGVEDDDDREDDADNEEK